MRLRQELDRRRHHLHRFLAGRAAASDRGRGLLDAVVRAVNLGEIDAATYRRHIPIRRDGGRLLPLLRFEGVRFLSSCAAA